MKKKTIAAFVMLVLFLLASTQIIGDDKQSTAPKVTAEILLKIAASNEALDLARSRPPKILIVFDSSDSSSTKQAEIAANAFADSLVMAKAGFPVVVFANDYSRVDSLNLAEFALITICGLPLESRELIAAIGVANRTMVAGFNSWESQMMVAVITNPEKLSPQIHLNWLLLQAAEIPLPVELLQFFSR